MTEDSYVLLLDKTIIEILDGNTNCGSYTTKSGIEIKAIMPYLTGKDLCDLSNKFGLEVEYCFKGALSRWQYLYNLLDFCIKNGTFQDLMSDMFSMQRFNKVLKECRLDEIEITYREIISIIVQEINKSLLFKGYSLTYWNNVFYVQRTNDDEITEMPNIEANDEKYIKFLIERAKKDIENKNYDSAITKSRTIVEESLCFMIQKKNPNYLNNGEIGKLLKQFLSLYKCRVDGNTDDSFKKIISGLTSAVHGIAEIRNKMSDSHGVGLKRVELTRDYAQFALNASVSISEFILSFKQENM